MSQPVNGHEHSTLQPVPGAAEWAKRLFDVLAAGTGLVVALPAIAVIALLITSDSRGPIFYRGVRIGRYGHPFRIVKFRTMVVAAERMGGPSTSDDDPRITPVGRFLRKYKLDELPQLINVLRGEMSIVGPRPEVPQYVALFNDDERAIFSVRPGMTDWASIWDVDEGARLAGSEDVEQTYLEQIRPEKIRLQLKYVRERSFLVDLQIIAQTFARLLRRRPAQELSTPGGLNR